MYERAGLGTRLKLVLLMIDFTLKKPFWILMKERLTGTVGMCVSLQP